MTEQNTKEKLTVEEITAFTDALDFTPAALMDFTNRVAESDSWDNFNTAVTAYKKKIRNDISLQDAEHARMSHLLTDIKKAHEHDEIKRQHLIDQLAPEKFFTFLGTGNPLEIAAFIAANAEFGLRDEFTKAIAATRDFVSILDKKKGFSKDSKEHKGAMSLLDTVTRNYDKCANEFTNISSAERIAVNDDKLLEAFGLADAYEGGPRFNF